MNFKAFTEYVKEHILEVMDCNKEDYDLYTNQVVKNNGVELTALQIVQKGDNCTPSIYLEPYYKEYLNGCAIEELLEEMAEFYQCHQGELYVPLEDLTSFSSMQDSIIMRLVNYERNETMLAECPHIKWHDLAITFRWLAHRDDVGIATALITNREMEMWKISLEQLHEVAMKNTPEKFPSTFYNMKTMLLEMMTERGLEQTPEEWEDDEGVKMFIVSNKQRINGATSILYPDVLADFAETKNTDLFILPSSIHEVILIPKHNEMDVNELKKMVWDVNLNVVDEGEILSNHIYLYSREKNAVMMC